VREYYEELWSELPDRLEPPDFALRRRFLLGDVTPGARVLDVGCGEGTFTAELVAMGASPVGVDVAEAALRRARARVPGADFVRVQFDGELPFADGSFALAWASEVIEHVGDTARWLSELRRVLEPGGVLLVTTPSHGRLRVALGGVERFSPPLGDHLHLYTRRSLARTLREFGFSEVTVRLAGPPLLRRMLLARGRR